MGSISDIERKVDRMKAESDATARELIHLRTQREDFLCRRQALRDQVAMLMQHSQHREQVCWSLQDEIRQLRTRLTGTSLALGQTSTPMAISSFSDAQASSASEPSRNHIDCERLSNSQVDALRTPDSRRISNDVVAFPASAAEHVVTTPVVPSSVPDDRQLGPAVSTPSDVRIPSRLNFSSPPPVVQQPQTSICVGQYQPDTSLDVRQQGERIGVPFVNMLVSSPVQYYANRLPKEDLSLLGSSYYASPDHLPPSRFTTMRYDDPNKYFNWDQEVDDSFPELSMVSRQAAAEPSDLFSAILDNMCADDPFPVSSFGCTVPLPFEDGGPSVLSSPTRMPQPIPGSPADFDTWVSPIKQINEGALKQGSVDPKPPEQ